MKRKLPVFGIVVLVSCAQEPRLFECRRAADCSGEVCVAGRCRPGGADGSDVGIDDSRLATLPNEPLQQGPCTGAVPVGPGHLTLNELLANVPAGPDGDANADGVRDPYEDEFVEIVSITAFPLELDGLRILFNGKVKYTFEPTCLLPGEGVVVFGGGSVGSSVRGSAIISETRFSFSNEGGEVDLVAATGASVDKVAYGRSRASSLTRSPQVFGAEWSQHNDVSPSLFSPGRCANGATFVRHCTEQPDMGSDQ